MSRSAIGRGIRVMTIGVCALLAIAGRPASASTQTPSPPEPTFDIARDVPLEIDTLVRESIRLAQDHAVARLGHGLTKPFKVVVRTEADGEMENRTNDREMQLSTWTMRDLSSTDRVRLVIHEYAHAWTEQVSGMDHRSADFGPAWLTEGLANAFAYDALAATGLLSASDATSALVALAGSTNAFDPKTPLVLAELTTPDEMATPGAACCSYAYATLAARALLRASDFTPLVTYVDALAIGRTWEDAFALAFNITYDRFTTDFDGEFHLTTDENATATLTRGPAAAIAPA